MSCRQLLFHTAEYGYFEERVSQAGAFERGVLVREVFPDGERYLRIESEVGGRDVVLIGGTIGDAETLELYDLASALVKYGARTLTMVVPYFGYSTMERAIRRGEVVTAKTRARLLSSVPSASFGNRVVMIDLHSEGLPHYFEGSTKPVHLYAKSVVKSAIESAGGEDFILGCTDAGRAKWVQSLANEIGCEASFVLKRRSGGAKTEVIALSGRAAERKVVLFDDMVRSGTSLLGAARAYREAGAAGVTAVVTHCVLPNDSLAEIERSGLLEGLLCTDSHPRAAALAGGFLRVKSIAGLVAEFLDGKATATY